MIILRFLKVRKGARFPFSAISAEMRGAGVARVADLSQRRLRTALLSCVARKRAPKTTTTIHARGQTRQANLAFGSYWRPVSQSSSISDCSGFGASIGVILLRLTHSLLSPP